MGTAKGIAGADYAVRSIDRNRIHGDVFMKERRRTRHRARRLARADRDARERQFDQSATAQRMAETAFPTDQRRIWESSGQRGTLQFSGFECSGAMALQPNATSANGFAHGRKACGKSSPVSAVGGEMMHLVVQTLTADGKIARVTGQNRKRGSVAQTD